MTPHMCNHLDWKHCHQQMSDELPVLKCILGNTALGLMLLKDFAVTRCALTGLVLLQVTVPLMPYNKTRTLCHAFHACSDTHLHLTAKELTGESFYCEQPASCNVGTEAYGEAPQRPFLLPLHSHLLALTVVLYCAFLSPVQLTAP